MNKLFLLLIIPLFCDSQTEKLQPIGSIATYVISCPCKLFKYYEDGEMFYFCADKENNIEYQIKEFRHKNGLGVVLNSINKKLLHAPDSTIENDKKNCLKTYLDNNSKDGAIIDFMQGQAVLISRQKEKKIFFSDEDFIASYEITVTGTNSELVTFFFKKSINSLMLKKNNFKTIF